jgi:hypothetical protein
MDNSLVGDIHNVQVFCKRRLRGIGKDTQAVSIIALTPVAAIDTICNICGI